MFTGTPYIRSDKLQDYLAVNKYATFKEIKDEIERYFVENKNISWTSGAHFPASTEVDIYRMILRLISTVEKQQEEINALKERIIIK